MKIWPNRLFLDRLALPHMSTNFWMCFCGILFNFQGLRRTFPKSVLELKTTVDHQIWGNTPIGWHKMDGPMGALLQVMIQIDTNRWHWLQIVKTPLSQVINNSHSNPIFDWNMTLFIPFSAISCYKNVFNTSSYYNVQKIIFNNTYQITISNILSSSGDTSLPPAREDQGWRVKIHYYHKSGLKPGTAEG